MTKEKALICIGAQRTGTTWLHRVLEQHPDFSCSEKKEPDFFRILGEYHRGEEWYFSRFKNVRNTIVDITPEYALAPETPELIRSVLGDRDTQIIFIIRKPEDRILSSYNKMLRNQIFSESLDFFVKYDIDHCVSRSQYYETYISFKNVFSNIQVLVYEDFVHSPEKWLAQLNEILDVKLDLKSTSLKFNPTLRRSLFTKALNSIYRPFSGIPSVKLIKSKLEQNSRINHILYRSEQQTASPKFNSCLQDLFREDAEKIGIEIKRDLVAEWYPDDH